MNTIARQPGAGAYAKAEIERRYLLAGPAPASLEPPREVADLYLDGLRMRLRRQESAGIVVFKLTQKIRILLDDPHQLSITNIYLDEGEYLRLARLPGKPLSKTRSVHAAGALQWCVDLFHGALEGLMTAEVEVGIPNGETSTPPWVGLDVTHDDRYSGGRLAYATNAERGTLLAR